jgi:hypothetical protein
VSKGGLLDGGRSYLPSSSAPTGPVILHCIQAGDHREDSAPIFQCTTELN